MIQEIGSVSSMPNVQNIRNDINEHRNMLKALLDSAGTQSTKPESQNGSSVQDSRMKKDKDNTDHKINYSSLSKKIQPLIDEDNLDVKFDKDHDTNIMVMKFIDKDTKDTVKQFPPEITIKVAKMVAFLTENGAIADATI